MTDSQFAQLLEVLKKIGEAAQAVGIIAWTGAVKQQYINGTMWFLVALTIGMVAIALGVNCIRAFRHPKKYDGHDDLDFAMFLGVVTFMATLLFIGALQAALSDLLNPEWQAIQMLLGMIK